MDKTEQTSWASDKVWTDQMEITPETAADWLSVARMPKNRVVRPGRVTEFALAMAAGQWRQNGETLKFDRDGFFIDGQHRLLGVVQSGVTILTGVTFGLDPDVMPTIDTGTRRTAADAMGLEGYSNRTVLSAAVRMILNYERGDYRTSWTKGMAGVSNSDILAYVQAHPEVCQWAAQGKSWGSRLPIRTTVMAFCAYEFSKIDEVATIRFFESMASMMTNGTGDPRYALITRMQRARTEREKLYPIQEVYLVFRAWNAWRKGQKAQKFNLTNRDGEPMEFPTPI